MSGGVLVYEAKRALLTRLQALAGDDPTLSDMGLEVTYAWTGGQPRRTVYFGATRMSREQATAEYGAMAYETDVITMYVRAFDSGEDVQATEADVETIVNHLNDELSRSPKLGGTLTWLGITSGDSDYTYSSSPEPTITVVLRCLVTVQGYL